MEMPKKYDETVGVTGEYEGLKAGGYICRVVSAKEEESRNGNRMLVVAFDIAEGDYKDFYKKRYEEAVKNNKDVNYKVKWPNNGVHRLMVEDKDGNCNKFFKGFITVIENSNENYNFKATNYDEKTLKDKLFGGVFGEEEYEKTDGKIGTSVKLRFVRSVESIEDGKYEIPEVKKLQRSDSIFNEFNVTEKSDDDLPF